MTQIHTRNQQGIEALSTAEFNAALGSVLQEQLVAEICKRGPGHCMRISNLETALMNEVAISLKETLKDAAQIFILVAENPERNPLWVTGTKLVELRNPLPDGRQRPPLLVFVPDNLKASAEDSFGEATFETLSVRRVYDLLIDSLLTLFPSDIREAVVEMLKIPEQRQWPWADPAMRARYLLTIRKNGYDPEVVGAALYELALIPDFRLMEDRSQSPGRLSKNLDCVDLLTSSARTELGKVLDLGLTTLEESDKAFIRDLGRFFVREGLEDPSKWTARLATDPRNWLFTFDKWTFAEGNSFSAQISVEVTSCSIQDLTENPANDSRLAALINQPVLIIGSGGQKQFKVSFRVSPHPESVPAVDHFKIQIISRSTGAIVGNAKRKKAWVGGKTERSVSFTKLHSMDWEEGWHYVRVLAYTKENDLIPIVDQTGAIITNTVLDEDEPFRAKDNESDTFYVVVDNELDAEPTVNATPRYPSLLHAEIALTAAAMKDKRYSAPIRAEVINWFQSEDGTSSDEVLEVKFSQEGSVRIPVPTFLKDIERRILSAPDGPFNWHVTINHTTVGSPEGGLNELSLLPEQDAFLTARRAYFDAIRSESHSLLSVAVSFPDIASIITNYGESYLLLLDAALAHAERNPSDKMALLQVQRIASIDRVDLDILDHRGTKRQAALVGPTHPLRALWLAAWSRVSRDWLDKASHGPEDILGPTCDALTERLTMMHFPAYLIAANGRILSCVANVHPYWSFYTSGEYSNPKGLVAEFCTAAGMPEPVGGGQSIGADYLAERIRRYVLQHPYVETLSINSFNPGRAKLLADTLLKLQDTFAYRELRYDIRLFVPDPEASGTGEDLQNLVSPSSSLAESADVFCSPTGNHLAPKLSFSIRSTKEFEQSPSSYIAHLTLLFDVFPAQEVSAVRMPSKEDAAPVQGLMQDFKVTYREDGQNVSWEKSPRHSQAVPFGGADVLTHVLCSLSEAMSNAAANVATNQCGVRLRPAAIMHLGSGAKALLHHVHEVSDWVFTADRNLGIEFFDHGGMKDRPEYLIDHSPDITNALIPRLFITSRVLSEAESLFVRAVNEHHLPLLDRTASCLLAALRGLSGRLALKLMSTYTQRMEALGLALAKLYLEYQGVFDNQVVVPLDAHIDLYNVFSKAGGDGADINLKRTDLALFDFNAKEQKIICRLVEVKCYQSVGGLAAYSDLQTKIGAQIAQSEKVIRHHFDPLINQPHDRPDRPVKNRELVALLEFYLDRAHRLGSLSDVAWDEAKYFLRTIELQSPANSPNYSLVFTRSAIIFDFEKSGTEDAVVESGVEFHRIGKDLVENLLEVASSVAVDDCSLTQELQTRDVLRTQSLSAPRIEIAAYKSSHRDRTVDWEQVEHVQPSNAETSITEPLDVDRPIINIEAAKMHRDALDSSTAPPPIIETDSESVQSENRDDSDIDVKPPLSRQRSLDVMSEHDAVSCCPDIIAGVTKESVQYGVLGECNGRTVALDLDSPQTISLFGVQGGGKSYTLGSIIEMASMPITGINKLPAPLASVVFHYSQTQDYSPEFTSMIGPNDDTAAIDQLMAKYKAEPQALKDIVLLTPAGKLAERRAEYPDITVLPLQFSASELQAQHWRFLMGAIGNQATYIRQLNRIMRSLREQLTLDSLKHAIDAANLSDAQKSLAHMRLSLAEEYIDDNANLGQIIRPGRLIIVDLRDEFIEKDEALGLFVVILQIFSDAKWNSADFNKLVVFDEAHKYIDSPDLVSGLIEVVREMRHKGTSILVASQDPPSVPVSLIELSSQIILHQFNSPGWLKHIQKANAALMNLSAEQMSRLRPGEGFVWSSKATDPALTHQAVKMKMRPRFTAHGGGTKQAVR